MPPRLGPTPRIVKKKDGHYSVEVKHGNKVHAFSKDTSKDKAQRQLDILLRVSSKKGMGGGSAK